MTSVPVRKEINEQRAALLLGLTLVQLRQLWEQSGLSCGAAGEGFKERLFTYEELYRLCRWVARPAA